MYVYRAHPQYHLLLFFSVETVLEKHFLEQDRSLAGFRNASEFLSTVQVGFYNCHLSIRIGPHVGAVSSSTDADLAGVQC